MNLEIRIATNADLATLIKLYAAMNNETPLSEKKAAELFTEMAKIPNYNIYLAYLDNEAVGTFSLLIVPTMMHPGIHKFAVLDAVVVSLALRSRGIGTAMIQEALKLGKAAGCYKLTLSSNLKRSRAHHFYESLGFQQHGWSFSLKL
ncbi:MAG: GNAT family N-acetyltransferase [Oscillatoria sp. PMC 1068.18]|nr:GNAT family N-acetyltransferase [Oscillatoria sp. PMC 1076.18]MEC4991259.1 GNAT family N-acetyltransferase [Oscillatoria sp. PMC 1068.18]